MQLDEFVKRIEQWQCGRPEAELIEFMDELFTGYLEASDEDRRAIRRAVASNLAIWNAGGYDDVGIYLNHLRRDPEAAVLRHLRGWLIAVAMTGGCCDWRDTIVVLDKLRQDAESRGIATRTHFEQIGVLAASDNTHGVSGMSTRDLIWSAAGLVWFEGKLWEKEAFYRELAARHPATTGPAPGEPATNSSRPWWRFWGR